MGKCPSGEDKTMARFKVGDWVRLAVGDKMESWPAGKVLAVREDYQLPTIYAVEHEPGRADRIVNWAEYRLEPAPPPVGERPGEFYYGVQDLVKCQCWIEKDFDPSLWCACSPEPKRDVPIKVVSGDTVWDLPLATICPDCGGHFAGVSDPKTVHDCSAFVHPCRCPQGHMGYHEEGCSKL
jgi:hypothetical protein